MKLKQIKKGSTITVVGRRWFERVNGNTYHSCEVYLDSELVGNNPFTYGYGTGYEQTAVDILKQKYQLPLKENEALWRLKEYGVNVVSSVSDVQRKKDL